GRTSCRGHVFGGEAGEGAPLAGRGRDFVRLDSHAARRGRAGRVGAPCFADLMRAASAAASARESAGGGRSPLRRPWPREEARRRTGRPKRSGGANARPRTEGVQVSTAQRRTERYRPVQVLGHGGMASVELAHDLELDRPVAIKRLAEHPAVNDEFKPRLLRQARLAAGLSHPNIVGVYDVGETGGRPFIVMEYVEGETLADLPGRRGRLKAEEAVALVLQACAGLETAHEAGLVHRDVKPKNLLVTPGGTIKIADFGIARSLDGTQLTQAGTVLGTAAYLAPEQAAGEVVTASADVYALGAVLYELLTGRPPYIADSIAELVARQQEGTIAPVREQAPDVPAATEDAVMHALARDPEYRTPSAAALADDLRARPTAETMVQRPRAALQGSRRMLLAALALGGVLLVVFAAAVLFRGGSGSRQPSVTAPPSTGTPAQQAQAFGTWLREHASGR